MLSSFGASANGVIRFAGGVRSLLPFGVRGSYGITGANEAAHAS